jgi:hypothetical protein
MNFTLGDLLKGDINADNSTDLIDAIIALKALSGIDISGSIRANYAASGADVNGNSTIGIEDAIYIIQKTAGIR